MEYAKFREPSVTDVNAYTVAQKVIDVLNPDFEEKDVAVRLEADPLSIQADEEMFRQALVNLLLNSLHASEAGDSVTVHLHRDRHNITLTVEDEAEGIEAGLLPDVCKPYVSGTPEGHGMGLAVVKRIADQHGWDLEIVSNKQTGTSVSVSGIQGTVL
jgi:signal transduction histidine kinase